MYVMYECLCDVSDRPSVNKFGFSSNDQWASVSVAGAAMDLKMNRRKEVVVEKPVVCTANTSVGKGTHTHARHNNICARPTRIWPFSLSFQGAGHYVILYRVYLHGT